MKKYFQLQCKRLLRFLPGALLAAVVLLGSLLLAFRLFTQQNADQEENQKFPIAISGELDNSFLQMGLSALQSFDGSRFALDIVEMEESEAAQALAQGKISAYVVIPDGFMDKAIASGEILPIKFCTSTGASGVVPLVKEELSGMISSLLISSQEGVFGMWDAMYNNGLQNKLPGQMDRLSIVYVDYILARDRVYSLEELGVADALGLEEYILCGLCVLLLLLICLPFAPLMIPGDPALGRLLCSKGKPAWKQAFCDFAAYAAVLCCLLCVILIGAVLCIPELMAQISSIIGIFPVVLLVAAFSFMLYSLSRDMIGGLMLQFFVTVITCFVSGCLYPVHFFPVQVQQLAQWLPTGIARTQLASCITGNAPSWTVPMLLGYSAIFVAIGIWVRSRHIQEVVQ